MENYPANGLKDLNDFFFKDKTKNDGIIKATGQKVYRKIAEPHKYPELIDEYNELSKCYHPLIQYPIGIYLSENSNECSLLTPYQKLGSLFMFIYSRNKFSEDFTSKFILSLGIAFGMEYLHHNNIIHGNLNTNNILVNERCHPILIKFGNEIRELSYSSNLFSAPEVIRRENIEKSSDVYSFGLIINAIYSKKIPFQGVSSEETNIIKNNGTFQIDPSMPDFLHDIVRRCLNPNKEQRPVFSDILSDMISNIISTNPNQKITSFIEEIQTISKQKQSFKIPSPLIRLPEKSFRYEKSMENPVFISKFKKILNPNEKGKVILIMVFGDDRRSFIKSITGNNAHYIPVYETEKVKRILIDGPYKKSYLIDNIVDNDFKEQFNSINISDNTQIFFIDFQENGIDDTENDYCIVINRLFPIFSVISTVCVSIIDSNINPTYLTYLVHNLSLIQKNKPSKIFFLVKNYDGFDQITEINHETFVNFDIDTLKTHLQQIINKTDYYSNQKYKILPFGDHSTNYKAYIFSVWNSFLNILLSIDESDLISKEKLISALSIGSNSIFGQGFNDFITFLTEEKSSLYSIVDLLKAFPNDQIDLMLSYRVTLLCTDVALSKVLFTPSTFIGYSNKQIEQIILFYANVFMPLLLRKKEIPICDIRQWSNDLKKDINSFLKANNQAWSKHVNFDKCTFLFDDIFEISDQTESSQKDITTNFLYVSVLIINALALAPRYYSLRSKYRSFQSSSFPFIWDYSLTDFHSKDIDIFFGPKITSFSEDCIIFYEQSEQNDSSIILRSLTGFNVDFKNNKKCAKLFQNIPINKMMIRFKKNRENPHISKLLDPPIKKVNLLYLKGFTQKQIRDLCMEQTRVPIFVSSMIDGQQIKIVPTFNYPVYMFVISNDSFDFEVANRKNFIKNMIYAKEIVTGVSPEMKNMNFLPIKANDYSFIKAGPIAHNLLRYGCRYILKDESFFKDQ